MTDGNNNWPFQWGKIKQAYCDGCCPLTVTPFYYYYVEMPYTKCCVVDVLHNKQLICSNDIKKYRNWVQKQVLFTRKAIIIATSTVTAIIIVLHINKRQTKIYA